MKMTLLLAMITLLLSSMGLSCPSDIEAPSSAYHHLPAGGRKSLHGMVLFGAGPYFMEHIPMLTPPHDFQIITEVELKNKTGESIKADFSNLTLTLKPSENFSLNDFISGRLKTFSGTLYQGSFETTGKVLSGYETVFVEIKSYKLIRQLPSESQELSLKLSDGKDHYESVLMTPSQNKQKITNLQSGKTLWCVKGPDFFEACAPE